MNLPRTNHKLLILQVFSDYVNTQFFSGLFKISSVSFSVSDKLMYYYLISNKTLKLEQCLYSFDIYQISLT